MDNLQPQVDQPWQLQHPPEVWQQIFSKARADYHANPQDHEAQQAMKDAAEALSVYDEAEAAPPSERISSGVSEGLGGLGEAAIDIPRGLWGAAHHPIQTLENLPKLPGQLAGMLSSSNDAFTVARGVGNIGSLLLPAAKVKGGFIPRLAPAAVPAAEGAGILARTGALLRPKALPGPTVGGVALSPLKGLYELARQPGLRNAVLEAQQAGLASKADAARIAAEQIFPERAKQAGLRTRILEEQVGRQGPMTESVNIRNGIAKIRQQILEAQNARQGAVGENLNLRNVMSQLRNQATTHQIDLLEQEVARGPATDENLALRNEILQLRAEAMRAAAAEGGEGAAGPEPMQPGPQPSAPPNAPAGFPGEVLKQTDVLGTSASGTLPRTAAEVTGPRAPRPAGPGGVPFDLEGTQAAIGRLEQARSAMNPTQASPFDPNAALSNALQKTVTFGSESPLSEAARNLVKQLLGDMTRQ